MSVFLVWTFSWRISVQNEQTAPYSQSDHTTINGSQLDFGGLFASAHFSIYCFLALWLCSQWLIQSAAWFRSVEFSFISLELSTRRLQNYNEPSQRDKFQRVCKWVVSLVHGRSQVLPAKRVKAMFRGIHAHYYHITVQAGQTFSYSLLRSTQNKNLAAWLWSHSAKLAHWLGPYDLFGEGKFSFLNTAGQCNAAMSRFVNHFLKVQL